jgi:hypothetical protein
VAHYLQLIDKKQLPKKFKISFFSIVRTKLRLVAIISNDILTGASPKNHCPGFILAVKVLNPFQSLCIADFSQISLSGELVSILHLYKT